MLFKLKDDRDKIYYNDTSYTVSYESEFDKIVNKDLLIRKINICVGNLLRDDEISTSYEQLDLFTDIKEKLKQDEKLQKEKKLQETVIGIKNKYGKNAIIKAFNLEEGATTLSRNRQIGGHSE